MEILILLTVVFAAVFVQTFTGFGVALVSMAFLPGLLGIQQAAPLVALVALTLEAILLIRYRLNLDLKAVRPLILAALFGIPIGVWALQGVDQELVLRVLGIVIAGYALYALLKFRLPELLHPAWAIIAGFFAGILGGAYNTSGPPVILYADCKRWQPAEFKANLQSFFLVSDLFVVATHVVNGNFTAQVWQSYLWCLPAIAAAIVLGTLLSGRFEPATFRKVVLVLLVVLGIRLVL